MSIEIIKDQIDKFIGCATPEVMAIKGDWGVGKTYSWNKFLLDAKNSGEGRVCLEKYSYVSLFGINSLDSLKYAMFENVVNRELIGTEVSLETFKQNTASLLSVVARKSFDIAKEIPLLKGSARAIESLSFLSLNQTLICIDDLERKGSGLEIKDVFGLISLLKEQKKCKIVILLNDGEEGLDPPGLKDYGKYKEKVIDLEVAFEPTATECASIAFEKKSDELIALKELSQKLGIRNIRVLKKIERLVELSIPLMDGYEQETKYNVVQSLSLFTWCYYCSESNKKIPTLEFVTNLGYSSFGIGNDKKETENEKKWKSMLHDYGYLLTDELDLVLAESVRTGYFVEKNFKREAEKKNKEIMASKSESSFIEAWMLYHGSFDDNTSDVIDGLYKSFQNNAKHISLTNLNGTVTLFKELGFKVKATEIIEIYIEKRRSEKELFNYSRNNFFGDTIDPEIVEKFDEIYKVDVTTENAEDVLKRIASMNGWNPGDEVVLANTEIDEFCTLFKSTKGKDLFAYVDKCLNFGKFNSSTEQQREIAGRASQALKKIASESEINRRRVRKFGIELESA